MKKLRVAIIGCRNMGTKHYNTLLESFPKQVEISGILNSSVESSTEKAQELGCNFFESFDEISMENTDAAIIATPATLHCEQAIKLLNRGISCLVEKPFGVDEKSCLEAIKAQENNPKTTLMIGYVEIFNPAVIALKKELGSKKIKNIRALRTTSSYASNTDITIVQNLMSHDISVVRFLTDCGVEDILKLNVTNRKGLNMQSFAQTDFELKDGTTVDLTAHIEPGLRSREMTIIDESNNVFSVDCINRVLSKNGVMIHSGGNSLQEEQAHFIKSHLENTIPNMNGRAALEVEKMSLKIDTVFKKLF